MEHTDFDHVPDFPGLLSLRGKGFVVLGAGQGIGRQSAHALAQAGAKVYCVDVDESLAAAVAREVKGIAGVGNVTVAEDVQRLFKAAESALGKVNGIVDVVGMATLKPIMDIDEQAWEGQFSIVVKHAYLAIRYATPLLERAGGGTMTFVGSVSGDRAMLKEVAYGASKAALHHLVRCYSLEAASRRIRVNAVSPGFIRTPRLNRMLGQEQWDIVDKSIPIGRAAIPYEIAGPILFLASDLSSHITGVVLSVDGGSSNVAAYPQVFAAPRPAQ